MDWLTDNSFKHPHINLPSTLGMQTNPWYTQIDGILGGRTIGLDLINCNSFFSDSSLHSIQLLSNFHLDLS